MTEVELSYKGRKEIIDIVSERDPLVSNLGISEQTNCSIIESEIENARLIKKGKGGGIFEVQVPGIGRREYYIKKGEIEIEGNVMKKREALDLLDEEYDRNFFYELNEEELEKADMDDYVIIFLTNAGKKCLLDDEERFDPIPKTDDYTRDFSIILPEDSYLCAKGTHYVEYYLGALLGEYFRDGDCINYFDTYSLFSCPKQLDIDSYVYYQYLVTDKVDNTLSNVIDCVEASYYLRNNVSEVRSDVIQNGILLQVLFAIAHYQQLDISHNDLTLDNIYLEYVDKNTQFNGEYLLDADYYKYDVGYDIYFPAIPVIVKLGNFEKGAKHDSPVIALRELMETGYNQKAPNYLIPCFDVLTFIASYMLELKNNELINEGFISDCADYIIDPILRQYYTFGEGIRNFFGLKEKEPMSESLFLSDNAIIDLDTQKPKLDFELNYGRSAEDLLKSNIVSDKYGKRPRKESKVVELGVL